MKDVWNKDPAIWHSMPLSVRLEEMRRWHCTGPSAQCASAMNTRATLASTIKDAQEVVVREDHLRTELMTALLETSEYDELYKRAMELVDRYYKPH